MQRYELTSTTRGHSQVYRFDGLIIGESSSQGYSQDPTRWSEHRIYRTSRDEYIVEKMGASSRPDDEIRRTLHHSETAAGVIECMYTSDDEGVLYLTRVARECIDDAAAQDPAIHAAYHVRDLT